MHCDVSYFIAFSTMRGAGAGLRTTQPDEHRPTGRVAHITNGPVPAPRSAVRQVVTTDRLGIPGKAARQVGCIAGHHKIPRLGSKLCCAVGRKLLRIKDETQGRNISSNATWSVLCGTAHKTDAATGEHGDLLDIIQESCGLTDFKDVAEEARRFLSLPQPEPDDDPKRRSEPVRTGSPRAARRLFAMARPVTGTLAEAYLQARGITALRETGSLRFHPRCCYRPDEHSPTETWPAMIAAVTDLDGMMTGAHRTWLDPQGFSQTTLGKAPIEHPRRAMGNMLGHAVRFGIARDIMLAGEGIETVLSVKTVLPSMPTVAALSAAHLAALLFPPTLQRLYVARDNDPAGDGAAEALSERASEANIETIALLPQTGDFNEDLRSLSLDALCRTIRSQIAPEDVVRFMVSSNHADTNSEKV